MSEKTYIISNGKLTVTLTNFAAQITSIKDESGKEYIWELDKSVWGKTAPVLFPVCGSLREDAFYHNGKRYDLPKHGFAPTKYYEVTEQTDKMVVMSIKSDEETLKMYPFEFIFSVKFEIKDGTLEISYTIQNTGNETMYYSVGCHEGYACPEGLEEYDLVFDEKEDLRHNMLEGPLMRHDTIPVETEGNALHMKYSHMSNDSLVFCSLKSRALNMVNRNTGKGVRVEFPDFRYLVLWSKQDAKLLCIEPWNGIPDRVDADMELSHKEGIISLEKGKSQTFVHRIIPII